MQAPGRSLYDTLSLLLRLQARNKCVHYRGKESKNVSWAGNEEGMYEGVYSALLMDHAGGVSVTSDC